MFWSDRSADTISRAQLDGSEVTVLVNSGLSTVGKCAKSIYSRNGCVCFITNISSYACMHEPWQAFLLVSRIFKL